MTNVTRKLQRRTSAARYSRGKMRRVIVILESPGDTIGFRLERERRVYRLPVGDLYCFAVRAHAQAEKDRKKSERAKRKGK